MNHNFIFRISLTFSSSKLYRALHYSYVWSNKEQEVTASWEAKGGKYMFMGQTIAGKKIGFSDNN